MKRTLRDLRQAAKRLGATLDESSKDYGRILVVAPEGLMWCATGGHVLPPCDTGGHGQGWSEAVKSTLEDMSMGLEACDSHCEDCEEANHI